MTTDYSMFIDKIPFISLKELFQNCVQKIGTNDIEMITDLVKTLTLYNSSTIYDASIPYYKRCLKMNLCNNFFKSLDMEDRKQKLVALLSDLINFQIKTNQEM